MEELLIEPETTTGNTASGRILIVDDDPVVAGMLGISLAVAGHRIIEVNSGEDALAQLADQSAESLPDVIFLDIEMGMGIDGYETCRRLRAIEATREVPIIFLSGHDEFDDRMRAYDAGGSDFMAKPFVPEEVLRKAGVAIRHNRRQRAAIESSVASDTEITALSALEETVITLKFSRGALACRTLQSLAALAIESMSAYKIECHIQLRSPSQVLTLTPRGAASPLEESIVDKSTDMGRIFSFWNRLVINYDNVSMLITNMPIADEGLCGRIRDQAATIAETAEAAVENINLRTEAISRADELRMLADSSRQAVEVLRGNYRDMQTATRLELEAMTDAIEEMYVYLGLTDKQESTISKNVRDAADRVLKLLDQGREIDLNLSGIVDALTKAGEYTVSEESDSVSTVELW
jgi:DNA-binding response OmpR family regulator